MAGTRRGPRLNLSRVDVGPLIQRAVRALLAEQATGRLGDVLAPKKPTTQASQPATRPGPKEPSKKPQEQLLDSIFDLINRPKRD
jgi:hypothetical protein